MYYVSLKVVQLGTKTMVGSALGRAGISTLLINNLGIMQFITVDKKG